MLESFVFEHAGRKFTCTVKERVAAPAGTWWWFTVSHDELRYAPFEAAADDTRNSVQARVIAYYERRQWVRAQPVVPRPRFSGPGRPPGPGARPTGQPPAK